MSECLRLRTFSCSDQTKQTKEEQREEGEAGRALVEDVHDAIADLVELIRTYQSKNKLSQVMVSTLFRRRQEEAEAVIERAIARLQVCTMESLQCFPLNTSQDWFRYMG